MRRRTKIVISTALVFAAVLIVAGAGMSWRPSENSAATIQESSVPNSISPNNSTPRVAPLPIVNQSDNEAIVASEGNQTSLPQTSSSQIPSSQSTANPPVSIEPTPSPQTSSPSSQLNQTSSSASSQKNSNTSSSTQPQSPSPTISPEPTSSSDKDSKSKPPKANDNGNKK